MSDAARAERDGAQLPVWRGELYLVAVVPGSAVPGGQRLADGRTAVLAEVAALASGGSVDAPRAGVTATAQDGGFVLDNGVVTVVVDRRGLLTRCTTTRHGARRSPPAPRATSSSSTPTTPTCGRPGTSTRTTATAVAMSWCGCTRRAGEPCRRV
ncbi:hypothetical protein SMALB_1678 [Streptomyces malaysiensis]|uniref:Uncharacterized protein n=1 Tax=Streptomyces malaysiensis TaxID=92644 RepID=A0A7X5WZ82_STRMQ|nr:hypothetical protein [Streptomyces malaysiensis]